MWLLNLLILSQPQTSANEFHYVTSRFFFFLFSVTQYKLRLSRNLSTFISMKYNSCQKSFQAFERATKEKAFAINWNSVSIKVEQSRTRKFVVEVWEHWWIIIITSRVYSELCMLARTSVYLSCSWKKFKCKYTRISMLLRSPKA